MTFFFGPPYQIKPDLSALIIAPDLSGLPFASAHKEHPMAKKTQYARIESVLTKVGKHGASYRDLIVRCGTNWPHKRLSEMERAGYTFKRWQTYDTPARTMVALVSAPK